MEVYLAKSDTNIQFDLWLNQQDINITKQHRPRPCGSDQAGGGEEGVGSPDQGTHSTTPPLPPPPLPFPFPGLGAGGIVLLLIFSRTVADITMTVTLDLVQSEGLFLHSWLCETGVLPVKFLTFISLQQSDNNINIVYLPVGDQTAMFSAYYCILWSRWRIDGPVYFHLAFYYPCFPPNPIKINHKASVGVNRAC